MGELRKYHNYYYHYRYWLTINNNARGKRVGVQNILGKRDQKQFEYVYD